jgi:hypothetical protein
VSATSFQTMNSIRISIINPVSRIKFPPKKESIAFGFQSFTEAVETGLLLEKRDVGTLRIIGELTNRPGMCSD